MRPDDSSAAGTGAEEAFQRGRELLAGGDSVGAEEAFDAAVALDPEHAGALNNLALLRAGRGPEHLLQAVALLERARATNRASARTLANLGRMLVRAGRAVDAVAVLREAVSADPSSPNGWLALAYALEASGDSTAASVTLENAVLHVSKDASVWNNLGVALSRKGRAAQARAAFERAVELAPETPEALWNLGDALRRAKEYGRARELLDDAVALGTGRHEPLASRAILRHEVGDVEGATEDAVAALSLSDEDSRLEVGSEVLFLASHDARVPPAALFSAHLAWGSRAEALAVAAPRRRRTDRRTVVGYLSPDLCAHVVTRFLAPVLAAHDPDRVRVVLLSATPEPDEVTASLARRYELIDLSDLAPRSFVDALARAEVDVLVDLAGHTSTTVLRHLAGRVAPRQLAWLGYPGTTGLSAVDGHITDALIDPPGQEGAYVEQLVRLPRTPWALPIAVPDGLGVPRGGIRFGVFNRPGKWSAPIVQVWCSLLQRLPESSLTLRARAFSDPRSRARLLEPFIEAGVAARVDIMPWAPTQEMALRDLATVDVALDTFPYQGTTTTCEALAVGTSVISLDGPWPATRVARSLLAAVGGQHLLARSVEELLSLATELAGDLEAHRRGRSRRQMAYADGPLADPLGLASALEGAFGLP